MTNPVNLNQLKQYMDFYKSNMPPPQSNGYDMGMNAANAQGAAFNWAQSMAGGNGGNVGGGGTSNRMPDYFSGQPGGGQTPPYTPPRYSPPPLASGGGMGEEQGVPAQNIARQAGFPMAGQQAGAAQTNSTVQPMLQNYLAQILQRTPRF